jgi:hypothetical protein
MGMFCRFHNTLDLSSLWQNPRAQSVVQKRLALLGGTAEAAFLTGHFLCQQFADEGARATLYSTFQPLTSTAAFAVPTSLAR